MNKLTETKFNHPGLAVADFFKYVRVGDQIGAGTVQGRVYSKIAKKMANNTIQFQLEVGDGFITGTAPLLEGYQYIDNDTLIVEADGRTLSRLGGKTWYDGDAMIATSRYPL
ncbi:hypothetical protein [Pseudomonas sp. NA-150]|uniref:hypothetical protein n=1 Tax=Pseudomonas sp. NA-150 TaxID=3367525 RepID=UPI0037C97FD8